MERKIMLPTKKSPAVLARLGQGKLGIIGIKCQSIDL